MSFMYVARRNRVGEGGRATFGLTSKGASHVLTTGPTIRNYNNAELQWYDTELYKGFFMLHEGDGQNVVRVLEDPYFYQTLEPCKMSCNDNIHTRTESYI